MMKMDHEPQWLTINYNLVPARWLPEDVAPPLTPCIY